ncbi:MAG: T9SS type A sorting domain-containing protein, partial [Ignavibacteriaceae bacterium]|nr:T9SS type A sorting domain-containing protein [Ignavibacteriaceae bacterium]
RSVSDEARIRNYQRWPILGTYVWPNYYVGKTYDDEMNYFKNWIIERFSWMDTELLRIVGLEETAEEKPSSFGLFQNYPNPFNPETTISYRLSVFSKVSLKVFDVLGTEIAILVNGNQNPGAYETHFKSNQLSSGIYFYQLRAGNFIQTRKMIVLK